MAHQSDIFATDISCVALSPLNCRLRFAPYAANIDRDSLGIYASSDLFAPHTREEILLHRCTVVVGASGTGKAIEFKQQALALQTEEGQSLRLHI